MTVAYRTAEAYARPNRNFVPTSGDVVFAPGETEKTFTVQTLADAKPSGDQLVMLNLTSVPNAAFGYLRRAVLAIADTDPANPAMVDDFEGHHPFQVTGDATLTVSELARQPAGSTRPGSIRTGAEGGPPSRGQSSAASFVRTFAAGQDWSGYGGLKFWYYGANSGATVKVNLLDNQAPVMPPPSQWVMAWSDEFDDPPGRSPIPTPGATRSATAR